MMLVCGKRPIEWEASVYHTLHYILTNPAYAGSSPTAGVGHE